MARTDKMRFMVVQARLHPYYIGGAHKFLSERGLKPQSISELLHMLTELVTYSFEQEHDKCFEDNEEALDYCYQSSLAFRTRAMETARVTSYNSAISTLKGVGKEDSKRKAQMEKEKPMWDIYDQLVAGGMSPNEAMSIAFPNLSETKSDIPIAIATNSFYTKEEQMILDSISDEKERALETRRIMERRERDAKMRASMASMANIAT